MPSILGEEDKETVKRFVPKQTNKIQAVAVARLYVAYPNRSKWTYTGLQGAVVLANDLVGNTYWVKMVDISVSWVSWVGGMFMLCVALTNKTHFLCSPATEASSGTRRYSSRGTTIRIAPFSTLSSWKSAWQAYPS